MCCYMEQKSVKQIVNKYLRISLLNMSLLRWKILSLFFLFGPSYCLPDGDLCNWMNGRKYYIDVGESGVISAENETSQSLPVEPNQPHLPQRCSVELITCPSCHFEVKAVRMSIPTCSSDNTCRCDFVWVKEAAYSKSGREFCGFSYENVSELVYVSKTKLVSVDFLYSGLHKSSFSLQFSAKKNVYVYKGGFDYYPLNRTGTISSPNFPGGYPSDYSSEYILQNVDTSGFVQLLFSDFQLSLWSYMEILDSNGSRIDVYNGNTFRPPAIISSGPVMTLKFQANDEYPSSGFLATYTFVGYSEKYWINRPSTECGGFVEDYGGAITMMNMVPNNMMRTFDCIWLIHPRNAHVPSKQVSVRVSQFDDMGPESTLTIRQGLYSESSLLETVSPFQHQKIHRGQEYVVPASVGLYIRLVGNFNNRSHLAIIYSTFHYDNCYAIGDFECGNGRCVKNTLRCDGFNHCGDGTDEGSCYGAQKGTPSPDDANWWRTLTPNYYFPKSDNTNSTGTNTLILVTSLAGLGMFVLTTVVILVKLHKQRQDDGISREILQTISGDIDAENSPHHRHHSPSDPPMYDPPPSYDDVIKFYLPPPPAYSRVPPDHSNQAKRPGEKSESSAAIKSRIKRKKQQRQVETEQECQQSVLRVVLPSEGQSRSSCRNMCPHQSRNSNIASSSTAEQPISCIESVNGIVPLEFQSSQPISHLISDSATCIECASANSFCECQGACCCSSSSQELTSRHETSVRKGSKASSFLSNTQSTNDRYFDISSSGIRHRTSTISFPFSKLMVVTVRPTRSKSFGEQTNSVLSVPVCEKVEPTKEENEHYKGVRRSSSDPVEAAKTQTSESSKGKAGYPRDSASPSISEYQQSHSSAIGECGQQVPSGQSDVADKSVSPSSWGILWNPVRKICEKEEQHRQVAEWLQSDKQPLIRWDLSKHSRLLEAPIHQQNSAFEDIQAQSSNLKHS